MDDKLVIKVFNPGTIGGTPCVEVERIGVGFDWDAGKLILTPAVPLTTLTPEEVGDIQKSARLGQSWHYYQNWKKEKAEMDAAYAKIAELEEKLKFYNDDSK